MRSPLPADLWAKVEALFQEAADLAAPAREAFVRERCGDNTQIRDEVLTLLAYCDGEPPDLLAAALHADAASFVEEVELQGRSDDAARKKGPAPVEAPRKRSTTSD